MLLQDKRIEINQHNKGGSTALMCASINGHKEIVEMLLDHKDINVNLEDDFGVTAILIAHRDQELLQILSKHKDLNLGESFLKAYNKYFTNTTIEYFINQHNELD